MNSRELPREVPSGRDRPSVEEIPQDALRWVPEHPDRRQRRLDMATLDQIPVGADAIGILAPTGEEDYLVGD